LTGTGGQVSPPIDGNRGDRPTAGDRRRDTTTTVAATRRARSTRRRIRDDDEDMPTL
jgi:hypothetical protein